MYNPVGPQVFSIVLIVLGTIHAKQLRKRMRTFPFMFCAA